MLKQRFWAYLTRAVSFINKHRNIFSATGILALIGILQAFGVWNKLLTIGLAFYTTLKIKLSGTWTPAIWVWLLILIMTIWIVYRVIKDNLNLGKVAGEFYDDFQNGLIKWDYKGNWKTEKEGRSTILSVKNTDVGGFTKKGFNWTDYEFSFYTKVVKEASGWIIRANGNDFFMVQLEMKNNNPKLRPHYHKEGAGAAIWFPDDNNSIELSQIDFPTELKLMEWIKVRIIVDGNDVMVYLNDIQALNYTINSFGIPVKKKFKVTDEKGHEFEALMDEVVPFGNYSAGKVGFRCGDTEHALFKKVQVKPL